MFGSGLAGLGKGGGGRVRGPHKGGGISDVNGTIKGFFNFNFPVFIGQNDLLL